MRCAHAQFARQSHSERPSRLARAGNPPWVSEAPFGQIKPMQRTLLLASYVLDFLKIDLFDAKLGGVNGSNTNANGLIT